MASRASNFRASRFDMNKMGVPDDYIDALLDDAYMERLIVATNQINNQRNRKLKRYFRLNLIIFVALIAQAFLGVFVAYYKTHGQPDYVYKGNTVLENVDMVLMLDAAWHNIKVKGTQHQAVQNFTAMLKTAMDDLRTGARDRLEATLREIDRKEESSWFRKLFPFLKWLSPKKPNMEDLISVSGGYLRIATGLVAHEAFLLHNLTRDLDVQDRLLKGVTGSVYKSSAQWSEAMKQCNEAVLHGKTKLAQRRFCVIIGDNEAMCQRRHEQKVKDICAQYAKDGTGVCPEDFDTQGSVLEFASEMQYDCQGYVKELLANDTGHLTKDTDTDNKENGMQLIMMFLVNSEREANMRLGSKSFREYMEYTTGCVIHRNQTEKTDKNGYSYIENTWIQEDNCNKFIMAHGYEELTEKAKAIARLLKQDNGLTADPNGEKDSRYYWFLLLPLNLLFYVIWSKVVQLVSKINIQAQRAMGQKKKMVKVTKTLVEKERRDSVITRFAAQLTEVEMAEVSSLRAPIDIGEKMTFRARLKGGYLRASLKDGVCDGHGHAFDPTAEWNFESVDPTDGEIALQVGQRVRIRNAKNVLLRVDAEGTKFVGDDQANDEATMFMIEHPEVKEGEDVPAHLGDTIRLKALSTGKYFAVHKDGRCDGNGDPGDPETQLDIDRGGQTLNSGTIVTLSSLDGNFMYSTPDGECRAGVDDFRYWLIKAKECPCSPNEGGGTSSSSSNSANGEGGAQKKLSFTMSPDDQAQKDQHNRGNINVLKQGDIVTLRGFNQNFLTCDGRGNLHCGKPVDNTPAEGGLGTLREDEEEENPETIAPETQDFMIERVGMALTAKHDNTIRRHARICLKPVRNAMARSGEDVKNYVKLNDDGTLTANARVMDPDISFIIDQGAITEMVAPLNMELMRGDVQLDIHPLWDKKAVRHLEALSAAWTKESDLKEFKGAVVVANQRGAYTVPKAQGEHAWVAVVNEGVDLHKAAAQAKSQGATGLIIRCEEFVSLDKLNPTPDSEGNVGPPVLPTVFVGHTTGKELDEKALTMIGSEFRKKYLTKAMRAIGSAAVGTDPRVLDDVHKAVGTAMMEKSKEKAEESEEEMVMVPDPNADQEAEAEEQSKYKWKVQSNTYYLWTRSGGGATRMNVNYGKKLPPMMMKKARINKSGTKDDPKSFSQKVQSRGSIVGVTLVETNDLKKHKLANELSEVLTTTQANEPLEQLSEESDFKIEYAFEEVEIAVGEKADELEEDDLINEEGAVIGHLAVPLKKFWLVAGGLVVMTTLITLLLFFLLNRPNTQKAEQEDTEGYDLPPPAEAFIDLDMLQRAATLPKALYRSFLPKISPTDM